MNAIFNPEFLLHILTVVMAIGIAYGGIKSRLDNNTELFRLFIQQNKEDQDRQDKAIERVETRLEARIEKGQEVIHQRIDNVLKERRAVPP